MSHINQRLSSLRQLMAAQGIAAYIVPTSDPHQSEYVADFWQVRQWISGFTGSMGYAVVTATEATVWTDSRYFTQCENELRGTEFGLRKQILQGAPEHVEWLTHTLKPGSTVACHDVLFSVAQVQHMEKVFGLKKINFKPHVDLISPLWLDRPALLAQPIFEHDPQFVGRSRTEKITAIQEKIKAQNADYQLVTTLDDIGWTLNLRGSDVACNPVFMAYLVIGLEKTWLFVNPAQVSAAIKEQLNHDNIFVKNYDTLIEFLTRIPASETLLLDTANLNFAVFDAVKNVKTAVATTFSTAMKAVKDETERRFIRQVMVKDGVALLKAFRWLEHTLAQRPVREYEFAAMIAQFRSDQPHYFGESFNAIVGYNANAAIMHYHPTAEASDLIHTEGVLLVDSGGQYADGTTDITRTIALSTPDATVKKHFTLVLKGHIALACAKFPKGTKGIQLDILARQFLWQEGLNFGHGTGHGVGYFMNVHEPPQGFTPALNGRGKTEHEIGMYSSNEPGFYKEGAYGIRLENLVLVEAAETNGDEPFLQFETVTLFPFDSQMIDNELLTPSERQWLNAYHQRVLAQLTPHLDAAEQAWLTAQCAAIG